MKSMTFLGTV